MNTTPTITVRKVIGRDLPNGDHVEIEAELSDHFSLTYSLWEKRGDRSGRRRKPSARDIDDFGYIDDDSAILKVAPELEPLARVHLAAPDGTPMHALANSWYFYSGDHIDYELKHYGQKYVDKQGTPRERAARVLRISVDDLPEGLDKAGFDDFVMSLRARWLEEADNALEVLRSIEDGAGR